MLEVQPITVVAGVFFAGGGDGGLNEHLSSKLLTIILIPRTTYEYEEVP